MIDETSNDIGRITYYAYLQNPPAPSLRKKKVYLTFVAVGDDDVVAKSGIAGLRRARILRLCNEAYEQGSLLAYHDLIQLLSTSLSTLKRDFRLLRKEGFSLLIYRTKQRSRSGETSATSRAI